MGPRGTCQCSDLRPEGGVRGSEKSLSIFGPARRAGPDDILLDAFVRTILEKIEVNFWAKINVNLNNSQSLSLETVKLVLKVRSHYVEYVCTVSWCYSEQLSRFWRLTNYQKSSFFANISVNFLDF